MRLACRVIKTSGAAREKRGADQGKNTPPGLKKGREQKPSPSENKKGGRQKYTPRGYAGRFLIYPLGVSRMPPVTRASRPWPFS